MISVNLRTWTLSSIIPVHFNVLKLAMYQLFFRMNYPYLIDKKIKRRKYIFSMDNI